MDDAHHRVRRPAARRPRPARLVRVDQAHAAQLDRPLHGRARAVPGRRARRRRHRGVHDAARHAVRRHLHGARARASARRRDHRQRVARRRDRDRLVERRSSTRGRASSARRARRPTRWRATASSRARSRSSNARPKAARRPVCSPARSRSTPPTTQRIPIFVADYVLMGYGTGAIMAVPAHDHRDFEFAREFELPIVPVIRPSDEWLAEHGATADDTGTWPEAYVGDGVAMNSANAEVSLDGLPVDDAKRTIGEWLAAQRLGRADRHLQAARLAVQPAALLGRAVPDRLRRHRPDRAARVAAARRAARDHQLRAGDLRRSRRAAAAAARARRGLGGGRARPARARRGRATARARARTSARPTRCRSGRDRAGTTCATSTPPTRTRWSIPRSSGRGRRARAPTARRRPGSSTSTSAASSTRCCTCSTRASGTRCCYDLGHVSTLEPFQRLVNQGMVLAAAYTDERGMYVEASEVEERDGALLPRRARRSSASSGRWARA